MQANANLIADPRAFPFDEDIGSRYSRGIETLAGLIGGSERGEYEGAGEGYSLEAVFARKSDAELLSEFLIRQRIIQGSVSGSGGLDRFADDQTVVIRELVRRFVPEQAQREAIEGRTSPYPAHETYETLVETVYGGAIDIDDELERELGRLLEAGERPTLRDVTALSLFVMRLGWARDCLNEAHEKMTAHLATMVERWREISAPSNEDDSGRG